MISLDVKAEPKASSPSTLSLGENEPTTSFSDLLRGMKGAKDDKPIQNGAFVLALTEEKKPKATFASLLSNDPLTITKGEKSELLVLNANTIQNLSIVEVKTLIADAKTFLKNKILNSDAYLKSQMKELPQTLKGLATMAKTFGVDVSKITLEEVQASGKKIDVSDFLDTGIVKDNKFNTKPALDEKQLKMKETKAQIDDALSQDLKVKDTKPEILKELKATPLFKAQERVDQTTQQFVQTKQFKIEEKTPKTKADETLKLLLRGEKPNKSGNAMTADFAVATARVIAPEAKSETTKSLEQLLHGDIEESTSKIDGLTTHKADSFEVKLNEAKQMVKYLSQDVKTAIEDYKSPFTRIKVQLNPAKMGEVDITIVSRGKNLHVNISANTAAINTLAINASELRTQLNNNGIQNATLNFNNSSQNSDQGSSHQQRNPQQERQAKEEYDYFENEEQNEEILSSLEIVVPNYI
ncbi:flagellar hook-length control protein FliK [Sulfurimonas sp. SAG-AH-194-I05]|nr:flagellar hook-length control protein FliK [Sulfurimonas sp. SAG-AH-194-I05]MDF1875367.1 flagellar hook-length control protein FliK [Sulfurimonas sp. SAG-AH-194-I05]